MKYLQVSFYTLIGIKKAIELGDFTYGEWIVYDSEKPKYHVNIHTTFESDKAINRLLNKAEETIESILQKINNNQDTELSLNALPFLRIRKQEQHIDLELIPLPENWVKNIE